MELLKRLYEISSPSESEQFMREFIVTYCKSLGCKVKVDKVGNVYAKKGKSSTFPCVVAHMDEVCPERPIGYKVMEVNGRLFGFDTINCTQCGIGGDDKNGIWIALKCLNKYDVIKCAFFVGEEMGCIGSSDANMDWFKNCRFVVQCDRKGNSDLVTTISGELCSNEFVEAINPTAYGYKESSGLLTDVLSLKENGLGVSAVNMSCGYYNPHTEHEYTIIEDIYKCLDFVEHIIEDCTKVYPHNYTRATYSITKTKKCSLSFEEQYSEAYDSIYMDYAYYPNDRGNFEYYFDWYKIDYPLLSKKDFQQILDEVEADFNEERSSMRKDVRSKLINNPTMSFDDLEEELSHDYDLSYDDIYQTYNEFMS